LFLHFVFVSPFLLLLLNPLFQKIAATIFWDLIEQGVLRPNSTFQEYFDFWTDDPTDYRSQITLRDALAFQTGYEENYLCAEDRNADPYQCMIDIYNSSLPNPPGSVFHYDSVHMHLAGRMAVEASGKEYSLPFPPFH